MINFINFFLYDLTNLNNFFENKLIFFFSFEQNVNLLDSLPSKNLYSIWSFFYVYDFFLNMVLSLLWLPLFFSIIILYVYLRSLYKNFYYGLIFNIEQNDTTYFVWDFKNLKIFYRYIFLTFSKGTYIYGYALPNPLQLQKDLKNYLFINYMWRYWKPPLFKFFLIFFFILTILFFFHDMTVDLAKPVSIFLASYLLFKRARITLPSGLRLKHFTVHFNKNRPVYWRHYHELLYPRIYHTQYPIFMSFLHFIFTTIFVFFMYCEFFFNPILTWNGYFLKTIISFFFNGQEHTNLNYFYNFDFFLGLDGLNIWLIWLTSLLVFLCSFFIWEGQKADNFFFQMGWIYLLQFASLQFFCVSSYFWMYIFFELSLLPIFVLIVYWGSNRRKIHAAYQMVLFTFVGSLFLLGGILMLYVKLKTFNTLDIFLSTRDIENNLIFSSFEKKLIWFLMFIGFAVKTPLYPFHIWLPEAHSEAPTTGSVLLAGVLLKMGTYGFLRFVIPLFPEVLDFFKTLVFSMCICGIIFSSLSALSQIDIKKIIAYSSIGHMGLVILGIYSMNLFGLLGASFMMISHGLVSAALFFCVGLLYKIYGTRSLVYYSSIAHFMPKFSLCFFIFILANMGFPGTAGFPAEVLIFSALVGDNFFLTILVGIGSIIGGTYSIWLLTRLLYGQISPKISFYWDLNSIEWKVLIYLTFLVLFFGIFPFIMLDFFKPFCNYFIF